MEPQERSTVQKSQLPFGKERQWHGYRRAIPNQKLNSALRISRSDSRRDAEPKTSVTETHNGQLEASAGQIFFVFFFEEKKKIFL